MKSAHLIHDEHVQQRLTRLLSFIIFLSVLNGTMFNVSVPDIAEEFGLKPSGVSWVITGYIVLFALGSAAYGRLADMRPVKNLITAGLIVMNAGSLLGLLAKWYPVLIAARMVQAGGGAAIPALSMLVATHYFPVHIKGRVLGAFASTVAFAAGVGPILGGYITGTFHWRYLFLVSLATVLTIPFFRKYLPDEEKPGGRFDLLGALLAAGGVASLLFSVTLALWWLLLLSAGFFAWFALHITRTEHPFVQPSLFQNSLFRNTIVTTLLSMGTVFGMMFMIPIMLRDLNALDADMIGLVMFPGAMSAAVLGTYGGRLADRYGSVPVVFVGMGFLLTGFILLSTFAGLEPVAIALTLMVCYIGFPFIQASLAHATSMTLHGGEMGSGMGIYNLFFFMSGALSAAGLGKLMDFSVLGFPVNPLSLSAQAVNYSNLFVLLALVVLAAACLFALTFGRRRTAPLTRK